VTGRRSTSGEGLFKRVYQPCGFQHKSGDATKLPTRTVSNWGKFLRVSLSPMLMVEITSGLWILREYLQLHATCMMESFMQTERIATDHESFNRNPINGSMRPCPKPG